VSLVIRFRSVLPLVAITLAIAGCGGAATPVPTAAPTPAPTPTQAAQPTATQPSAAQPTPAQSAAAQAGACPAQPAAQGAPRPTVQPPTATPLANPPAQPSGDGTTVTIKTTCGDIVIEVYNLSAPVAAQNFTNLAAAGFYDGLTFHRIVPGFVIQGGDPLGNGTGGPGYTIKDDPVVGSYLRGTVAMANTGQPDSAGSQFFIVLDDAVDQQLGKTYPIFGQVTQGMDVVDKIAAGPANGQTAVDPVVMQSVTVQHP
jgi:cyclophilin family peptidyl-prolyl cis-trans isomerase